jgi:hypothetical protein
MIEVVTCIDKSCIPIKIELIIIFPWEMKDVYFKGEAEELAEF